jgi:hypothetical protein
MRRRPQPAPPSLVVASTLVAACTAASRSRPTTARASAAESALARTCRSIGPLWGTDACPTLDRDGCRSVAWTGDRPSRPDYPACFGFSEQLASAPRCNILRLSDWTLCRNRQYVDCLLDGHLRGVSGSLCFVTTPADVPPATGARPRVTVRELCHYHDRVGRWPDGCRSG